MAKQIAGEPAKEMSFLDHLEELRWHIIRSVIAILVVAIAAFIAKEFIFDVVIFGPKSTDFITYRFFCWLGETLHLSGMCITELPFELLSMRMAGQFTTHMMVSFVAGLIIAFPYILYELWRFISPGLHVKERKASRGLIVVTSFLFTLGVAFGYFVIVPLSVQFLATYSVSSEVVNRIDLGSYISMVTSVTLSTGLLFELPVIIYFLSRIGLVTPEIMRTYRKHAIIVILIVAAIITPPDITSQILVSIPVMLLYEASIFVSKRVEQKRLKALKA
jgi:sec-independent protein translocase protein TatC